MAGSRMQDTFLTNVLLYTMHVMDNRLGLVGSSTHYKHNETFVPQNVQVP